MFELSFGLIVGALHGLRHASLSFISQTDRGEAAIWRELTFVSRPFGAA